MGLDIFSFAAPARVQVTLIPIGTIRRSRFESFVKRLQQDNIVRLGDVSPSVRPSSTSFSPLAFPEGLVVYDLQTSTPPPSHAALTPFEIYRRPLLILGVVDGAEKLQIPIGGQDGSADASPDSLQWLSQSLEDIRTDFPDALSHQMLVFDHDDTNQYPMDGLSFVPSPAKSRTTTIKTLMCDLTSSLLAEIADFAKSVQGYSSISTPTFSNASPAPQDVLSALPAHMTSSSRPLSIIDRPKSSSSPTDDAKWKNRMSLPMNLSSGKISRSATPDSRPTSPPPKASTPTTISDDPVGTPRNRSRDQSRPGSQDRGFYPYESSNPAEREKIKLRGRIGVIVGSLYLLAGRWPDAVRELVQSMNATRANNDYVWQAKATDHLLVCLVMCAWARMDFHIPDVLRPSVERPASSSSKSKHANAAPDFIFSKNIDPEKRLSNIRTLVELLPGILSLVLNLYTRAWTFADDKILPLSYSCSTLRFARLLTTIERSNGTLDEFQLEHIVLDLPPLKNGQRYQERRAIRSASELSNLILRAYPVPQAAEVMSVDDQIMILASIASLLSELGYHRKKAVVLKEILSRLLPGLVQARKHGAADMGVHPAASLASLATMHDGKGDERSFFNQDKSEQTMETFLAYVCESYGIFAAPPNHLGKTLGDTSYSQTNIESGSPKNDLEGFKALEQVVQNLSGSIDLKLSILRSCINICEALPDLSGALQYSALLLKTAGSGLAPRPESSRGSPFLSAEEQIRLANKISRTLNAAQHVGLRHPEAQYWDEFLVRGIELIETTSSNPVIPHSKTELKIVESIEVQKEKNPFIYNPFLKNKPKKDKEAVLVATEDTAFQVKIQNLYDFDLHIDSIKLETDKPTFLSDSQSAVIGPYRTQAIVLGGSMPEPGTLKITGCSARIQGCHERSFGIFREPWEFRLDVNGQKLCAKYGSRRSEERLHESASIKSSIAKLGPKNSSVAVKVIEAQPVLNVISMSVPQSAVMLLEGEKQTFSITLQNSSAQTAADLILLSFKDSHTSQTLSALDNKELSEIEIYELELSVSSRPSFQCLDGTNISGSGSSNMCIPPTEQMKLDIEILGKPGLSSGIIQVDYGHLGVPKDQIEDTFYTRQLTIPVAVTVNASVELVRSEVIPLLAHSTSPASELDNRISHSGNQAQTSSVVPSTSVFPFLGLPETRDIPHALLVLDFRNSWPKPLVVHLTISDPTFHKERAPVSQEEYHSEVTRTAETSLSIAPGTTIRLPMRLPKIYLTPSQAHAPIPSLNPATARQFVVSKTRNSIADEIALREAFWFREELLKRIAARWEEEGTKRKGQVEMRTLKMTGRMVAALRLEDVDIRMAVRTVAMRMTGSTGSSNEQQRSDVDETASIHKGSGETKDSDTMAPSHYTQAGHQAYRAPTCAFLVLRTTLLNRSPSPIRGILRLQPTLAGQPHHIALDLGKKLLVNGLLQRSLPVLEPGKEISVETEFVVLSQGVYEWNACVEEVVRNRFAANSSADTGKGVEGGGRPRAKTGELDISAALGRRTWCADAGCRVVAEDRGDTEEQVR